MFEVRLLPTGKARHRRWSGQGLARSIESAKAALSLPGDRAEVWSTGKDRLIWSGVVGDNNALSELIGDWAPRHEQQSDGGGPCPPRPAD